MTDPARILVVDDRPANVKALRVRLSSEGYEVLDRVTITDAADNPYWHDLRYRLRCR